MKRFLLVFIAFCVILSACSPTLNMESDVHVNAEESWFDDFFVEGECVTIKCYITVENQSADEIDVILLGYFPEDYEAGLLKEKHLVGILDGGTKDVVFTIPPGGATFNVNFCGTYGGLYQKQNRLLPDIELIIVP